MKISILLSVASLIALPAYGSERERAPFEPTLASQYRNITPEGLNYELAQFLAIGRWHAALDQLEISRVQHDFLKKNYDRSVALDQSGTITKEQAVVAKFKFDRAKNMVARLEKEVQQIKSEALVYKLYVAQEGDPTHDLRKEITRARIEEQGFKRKALQLDLASAEILQTLTRLKSDNGKILQKKAAIAATEGDDRELIAQESALRVEEIKHQIQSTEDTLKALALTLKSLESGS